MNDNTILNIVIIEDVDHDVEIVRESMLQSAANLIHFGALEPALEFLNDKGADVVLLDLNLPDSKYLDTMKRFRGSNPEIPCVVITSMEDPALFAQANSLGIDEFLLKTEISGQTLARQIRKAAVNRFAGQMEVYKDKFERIESGINEILETIKR